ncbi:prepilin peptidase [Brevibacillus gelatini]|uniref:Prepilin peptidase n=1 Tax=Brevibacillus gelatini TaxID=1655277 RepID=A0A3M8AST1_9BACL|nr:A24 family peptidase [Brevibacillus gelatini]RNB54256.1 prepilin peptidase [Brevibacillus gelatini]
MTTVLLGSLLTIAAWCDWRHRKIPNALTSSAIMLGCCYQWYTGTFWTSLSGVMGAFLLTAIPVACKGMGMGDLKLLMAVGAWSGWTEVYPLFLHSMVLCVLFVLLYPRSWPRLGKNLFVMAAGWTAHRQLWLPGVEKTAFAFPYAVFLLGAFLLRHLLHKVGAA